MEIHAKVYAMARSRELLEQAGRELDRKAYRNPNSIEVMEPCAVLPLTQTWYAFTARAEPTDGPEGWMSVIHACGRLLGKDGAVVVVYRSPDHPDGYEEYAWTTPTGGADSGESLRAFGSSSRSPEHQDPELLFDELVSERSARERADACRRKEQKEALRKENGDFEINAEGVLVKYHGDDFEVIIPDGVKEIGESAFVDLRGVERMIMECEDYDAPLLYTVKIPASVEKIGRYAFAYCQNLVEVEMTDHVRSIGDRAFEGCESLKEIRLSAGLTEIEEYTFFLCDSLRSISIPEGVTRIGEAAFRDCGSLNRVTLPKSLKSIGKKAFSGTKLKRVKIPKGVTEIGEEA